MRSSWTKAAVLDRGGVLAIRVTLMLAMPVGRITAHPIFARM
ncbi:hypothetical protein [Candidatus Flexifilum breve]